VVYFPHDVSQTAKDGHEPQRFHAIDANMEKCISLQTGENVRKDTKIFAGVITLIF
jgi:hypothetical protein